MRLGVELGLFGLAKRGISFGKYGIAEDAVAVFALPFGHGLAVVTFSPG
jgi:hypothetical protein